MRLILLIIGILLMVWSFVVLGLNYNMSLQYEAAGPFILRQGLNDFFILFILAALALSARYLLKAKKFKDQDDE